MFEDSIQKRCSRCKQTKFIEQFSKDKYQRDGYAHKCKQCYLDVHKARYMREPDYIREKEFRRRYGISVTNYNELLHNQGGICQICRSEDKKLVIDHNHDSGLVRALICHDCNTMIGFAHENIDTLENAIAYLLYWGQERISSEQSG